MHRNLSWLMRLMLVCFSTGGMAQNMGVIIGDEQLQLTVRTGSASLLETEFLVDGQPIENLTGVPWQARIGGVEFIPSIGEIQTDAGQSGRTSGLTLRGATEMLDWAVDYRVIVPGCITKTLTLTPKKTMLLEELTLWAGRSQAVPRITRTGLQDIAAFYCQGDRGLFVSLDFPWSRILSGEGEARVLYPPHLQLKAGVPYVAHSLTMGATRLTGRLRFGADEGEVAAMDAYVQRRHPSRFDRPMFVSCSINNRYTQASGGVIFYTMKDHPTLGRNIDLLRRELDLMPKLGVEYYQVFPGVFDWAPGDPSPQAVEELMGYARARGVRMGDYSGTSRVFCEHYNDHGNQLDHPDWMMQTTAEGKREGGYCFGNADFVDYYIQTVVPNAERYGFELHCLDFLDIRPCFDAGHGHPAGGDSVYHAVSGLLRVLEAINQVSPQMMTWSNSGNWGDFLPKIAWSNPNLYLTDPFIDTPWQGLNMTRLLDDARREQMVAMHYSRFVPYRNLTNCQYFFSQNSIVPDRRNYQYGALSTLALTPNLTLGEVRPWIDRQPPEVQREIIDFYKKWTSFIADHFDLWRTTYHAGGNPGMGSVEIYGHAQGNRGFIFVVNPHYWDASVELPLDATLGLDGQGACEIIELYPVERRRLTAQGPTATLGTKLPMRVAAQQVLVLEIRPAPVRTEQPTLYGLPGTVEATAEGYRVKTWGEQGHTERFAVVLPEGAAAITSATVRPDVPFQPPRQTYPTGLEMLAGEAAGALFEVTFRRDPAPTELRRWSVRPGSLEEGLAKNYQAGLPTSEAEPTTGPAQAAARRQAEFPLFTDIRDSAIALPLRDVDADKLGPLANFCGGYIENAFSERQETWIELTTSGTTQAGPGMLVAADASAGLRPLPELARAEGKGWWLQTEFALPFMYTIGAEPAFDEHAFLVLPMMRPSQARSVRAWVNGAELEMRPYRYPRNRSLSTWYADLVGSGARNGNNTLVVCIEFQ